MMKASESKPKRPVGAHLKKRPISHLAVHGGFGVSDDGRSPFQRNLLWLRGRNVAALMRIPPDLSSLSTWSWLT